MKKYWHRAVFLLLMMIGLPIFAVAATSMSFCQTPQKEMLYAEAGHETESGNCAMPCSAAHNEACEMGAVCGSCLPPLADASWLPYSIFPQPVHSAPSAPPSYASHIVELLERPPKVV